MSDTPTPELTKMERIQKVFDSFGWDVNNDAFAQEYLHNAWVFNLTNALLACSESRD